MAKSSKSRPSHERRATSDASTNYPPTPAVMSTWMLWILLAAVGAISISGFGLWYCITYRPETQLDASLWELRWRLVHGCSVPTMLIAFGMILRSHVFKGFELAKNRFSGSLLLLTIAWLTISGWGLYYTSLPGWREFYHQTHNWFGFGLIGLLAAHWILGYRSRRELKDGQVSVSGALRQTGIHYTPPD